MRLINAQRWPTRRILEYRLCTLSFKRIVESETSTDRPSCEISTLSCFSPLFAPPAKSRSKPERLSTEQARRRRTESTSLLKSQIRIDLGTLFSVLTMLTVEEYRLDRTPERRPLKGVTEFDELWRVQCHHLFAKLRYSSRSR